MRLHTTARAAVAALLVAGCPLAHAHAYPIHQAPGAGATVSPSQKEVAIDFDDRLEPAFSSIVVADAQGNAVTSGKAVVKASNKKHMSIAATSVSPSPSARVIGSFAANQRRTCMSSIA